jgi:HlyD family secretion protein
MGNVVPDRGTDSPPLRAKVRLIEPSAFTNVSALGVEEQLSKDGIL